MNRRDDKLSTASAFNITYEYKKPWSLSVDFHSKAHLTAVLSDTEERRRGKEEEHQVKRDRK